MKMSRLHIKTLKDSPFEGELMGQHYLFRAGMIKKIDVADYAFMPYGLGLLKDINSNINSKFEIDDFEEIFLSSHHSPLNYLKMMRSDIISYKELSKRFYYDFFLSRDDYKVKLGLMKARNYLSKNFISILKNKEDFELEIRYMESKIKKILGSMGLDYKQTLLQDKINEFPETTGVYVKNKFGDEKYFECHSCNYSALNHVAKCKYYKREEDAMELEEIFTPEIKTISDLEKFLNVKGEKLLKTLILVANIDGENKNIVVALRGDRELNISKLAKVLGISVKNITLAESPEILEELETFIGFAGPIGIKNSIILVDEEVVGINNMITGANKYNYHFKNVNYGRDYKGDIVGDFKYISENDKCPVCGQELFTNNGFTVFEMIKFGEAIGNDADVKYRDENMKENYCFVLYGKLDMYKLFGLYIESNSDENGICLNDEYNQYDYQIIVVNPKKKEQMDLGLSIYNKLNGNGFRVLLDDRDERAGSKFKDSDLMGIPVRIVTGKNSIENLVEFKKRIDDEKIEISVEKLMEEYIFPKG